MNIPTILSTQSAANRRKNRWEHSPLVLVTPEGDRTFQQSLKLD